MEGEYIGKQEGQITDDDLMRFTQGTRKRFIEELIKDGFPSDPKDRIAMLTAMADMDRTALGNKRIGANERQAAADALVARAISQISRQFGETNPFAGTSTGVIPKLDASKLPSADPVPGETDIGLAEENYQNLMEKFEQ